MLLWCLSIWQSVDAAVVEDLFDVKIAVSDQSNSTQNRAFSQAFKQVLVKVRGNSDILANAQIKNTVTKSTRFVRSYTYEKEASQLYILISFDSVRVENLIRSAGFPIWDKRRLDTLVWLAIETDNGAKKLVTSEHFPLVLDVLEQQAQKRVVPLIKPLWDLDDRQALNIYDIWGGFSLHLNRASERYGVNSVLSARIYQAKDPDNNTPIINEWLADWTMLGNGKLIYGQVEAKDIHSVAQRIVDVLGDNLALQYAVDLSSFNSTDNKVELAINNIDSIRSYAKVLNLFESLSVISHATLIRQQGEKATFELALLGDVEDLKNVLNMDQNIQPVVDEFGQPIDELEFFWVK